MSDQPILVTNGPCRQAQARVVSRRDIIAFRPTLEKLSRWKHIRIPPRMKNLKWCRLFHMLLVLSTSKALHHSHISAIDRQTRGFKAINQASIRTRKIRLKSLLHVSRTLLESDRLRGGALTPSTDRVVKYIRASKHRCWALLVISVMFEAAATAVNKRAADTHSQQLFVGSCVLFLIW